LKTDIRALLLRKDSAVLLGGRSGAAAEYARLPRVTGGQEAHLTDAFGLPRTPGERQAEHARHASSLVRRVGIFGQG
jgi:hypothetical protein